MEYIDHGGGRFVCVLPRSRSEDSEFRQWIQVRTPAWEKVRDRENPKGKGGPRDRFFVVRLRVCSQEGWPLIWVFSTLLRLKQAQSRQDRISAAEQDLADLACTLAGPRCRMRSRLRGEKEDRPDTGASPCQALPKGELRAGDRTYLPPGEAGTAWSRYQVRAARQETLQPHLDLR